MKDFYSIAGVSKQALWKHNVRETYKDEVASEAVLIAGLVIEKINQVGQSDIFYIGIARKYNYVFKIIDVYKS